MSKLYKLKNYKFILVIYVLILNTLGVFLVGSASPGDQKKQIIGMVSGILPVVGVPLPLFSYGGTSYVAIMASFGLVMSIHTHKPRFMKGN